MRDFKRFLNRAESVVLVLSIIGVFSLIMQIGFIKNMEIPTFYDDYEYFEEDEPRKNKEAGYIVLKRSSNELEKIYVNVNGKGKHKFDKKNELMLKVFDGDIIEIENTDENGETIIMVVGISKNVNEPKLNEIFTSKEGIKIFFGVNIN